MQRRKDVLKKLREVGKFTYYKAYSEMRIDHQRVKLYEMNLDHVTYTEDLLAIKKVIAEYLEKHHPSVSVEIRTTIYEIKGYRKIKKQAIILRFPYSEYN